MLSDSIKQKIRDLLPRYPRKQAVTLPALEQARERAAGDLPSGPFQGVPFLMKDLGGLEAGRRYTGGMRCLKDANWTERTNAYITDKFLGAGLVILGRTNTPELGLLPTTEPDAFGATRNPWDPSHSPGGSSGGSASAVAAGIVPAAHASDGGGSIRIPASHCGLVGLKPTRGRNSFGPAAGERWNGFSAEFVVTRSVRDAAALLDAVAGPMPGDPYTAPPPPRSFAAEVGAPAGRLRIGVMRTGWFIFSIITELALIYSVRTRGAFWKAARPSLSLVVLTAVAAANWT